MSARSFRKTKSGSATPRLLAKAPWLVGILVVVGAGIYVLSAARATHSARTSVAAPKLALPPEPPVELLEVPNSGLPCDVNRVLKDKCRRCHTIPSRHAAPLALLTWEQVHAERHGQPVHVLMARAIRTDSMPFRIPANPPIERLTAEERKTLLSWLDRGAPRGQCP